jgi:hypothetical protein
MRHTSLMRTATRRGRLTRGHSGRTRHSSSAR